MDQITDQDQPVSHPMFLACAPAWQPSGEILRTVRDLPGSVRPGWMICSPQILGMRGAI
jgi:hypothetical protein